jgi:beta-phosphoglucomutase family hydrolase
MIEAVIFDMDGVIINSIPTHFLAWQYILNECGVDVDINYIKNTAGHTSLKTAKIYKEKFGLDQNITYLSNAKIEKYNTLLEKSIELFPEFLPLLEDLKSNNIPISIATSEDLNTTNKIINKFNIKKYFSHITTNDMVEYGKPHPEIYLKSAQLLNVKPENCIAIEDSQPGVQAAKSAGMYCIAVLTTTDEEKLKNADLIVKNLSEIDIKTISKL